MAEMQYDATNCPNPEVVFIESLNQIAVATKAAICKSQADSQAYTDSQIAVINTHLANIDSQDTLTKINALKQLVETLDLDTDGSIVDNLLDIKDLATAAQAAAAAAQAAATAAQGSASQAVADALAAQQALAAFQISVNNSIASLEARVSNLESQVGGMDARISTLEDSVSQLQSSVSNGTGGTGGLDEEAVRGHAQDEICKNNKKIAQGLASAVLSFIATLEWPCPVQGE
jgi:chromosome segregation ATPase